MKDRAEEEVRINRYVSGEMDETERNAFEEAISLNSSLKQRIDEHIRFISGLDRLKDRINLKEKLEEIHAEMEDKKERPVSSAKAFFLKRSYRLLAVAAAVAFIAVAGTVFTLTSIGLQNEKQAVQYQSLRKDIEKIKRSQHQILKEIKEEPIPITPGKYSGTGFLISSEGYIATSYHVISEAKKVFVENEKYGQLEVDSFFVNIPADVAILKLKDQQFPPLPYGFNLKDALLGEKIFTLGYPRREIVYGEGYISSATGYDNDTSAYQVSIPVNPGNSGGPIIDESGNVVGLISGRQTATEGASFATRIKLLQLLEIEGIDLKKKNTLFSKTRKQQVKAVVDFVFEVKVVE